jgi:3-oxoacyl-[acyl-carrier-protein] synthase-1
MGLASCLGNLPQAAAAARAGLSRAAAVRDFDLFLPGQTEPEGAIACTLPVATFGFSGVGRLVAIATEMFRDLASEVDLRSVLPRARVFLGLPHPEDRDIDLDLKDDDDPSVAVQELGRRVLRQAFAALDLPWNDQRCRFLTGGHAAFARALDDAFTQRGRPEQPIIVGALDSLVEPAVLGQLLDDGRLKTSANPVGFIPGEAGAALVLIPHPADSHAAPSTTLIRSVALGFEPKHRGADLPPDGRVAAECVLGVLSSPADQIPPILVTDHNGEQLRAIEWGHMLFHLASRGVNIELDQVWYPALALGDVAAAYGAVATCLAAQHARRGYVPAQTAVVTSAADTGDRSAIRLSFASTAGRA